MCATKRVKPEHKLCAKITSSITLNDADSLDARIDKLGYRNRSLFIRAMIRSEIEESNSAIDYLLSGEYNDLASDVLLQIVNKFKGELFSSERRRKTWKMSTQKLEDELGVAISRSHNLFVELERNKEMVTNINNSNANLISERNAAKTAHAELDVDYERITKQYKTTVKHLNEGREKYNSLHEATTLEVDYLKEKVEKLEVESASLSTDLSAETEKLVELECTKITLESKIRRREESISSKEITINQLNDEAAKELNVAYKREKEHLEKANQDEKRIKVLSDIVYKPNLRHAFVALWRIIFPLKFMKGK